MMIDSEFQERARTKARETLDAMRENPKDYQRELSDPEAFVEGFVRGVDAIVLLRLRRFLARPGEPVDGDWASGEA